MFDVALVDLNYARDTTSGKEGLELLRRLRETDAELPVVAMTAWGTIDGAVAAMRAGARDYVQKPWDNRRLLATIRAQARARAIAPEAIADGPEILGDSAAIRAVLAAVARASGRRTRPCSSPASTEPARSSSRAASTRVSRRGAGPFVALNAGAVAAGFFESELFGHVKGAFTDARADRAGAFALAHGGTLFLDEVGNMPAAHQSKLLRVLESGELSRVGAIASERADVRVVATTNADLAREVKAGRFREDLLYRLNTVELRLPALRDRGHDVLVLATRFLARSRDRHGRGLLAFGDDAIAALVAHPWPGNVRELEHVVERAVLLARGDRIEVADLALGRRDAAAG